MTNRTTRWLAGVAAIVLLSASAALAADPAKAPPAAPTAAEREQMAAAHQKMADCLKSDRPMSECKSEMMKSAHGMKGDMGCPMMESGHHGGMMKGAPAPETPKE